MAKLTQSAVANLAEGQHQDDEVPGLRVVVGSRSASYKLVGRINDRSGRYVSIIVGRTDELSLRSARERARELRLALRRGQDPRLATRSVPTLRQAWERYEGAMAGELRPRTLGWYRQKVEHSLLPLLDIPLDRLDREAVRRLHEVMTLGGSPYAANGAMRVLKLLYNDAARSHDLPPNPVSRAVRMNKEAARDWAISPAELPQMWLRLDGMDDPMRRACWLAMLLTGLRRSEARSIEWSHIDAAGVLTVPSPKGGPDRAFRTPLPRLLLDELGRLPRCSPFAFPSRVGAAGHVKKIERTDDFPYAPHQMRHTYCTVALEAGVDFQTITLLMNHRPAGVSWGYVTRAHLIGHMRHAQELICSALALHRGR